jgi:kynureninase
MNFINELDFARQLDQNDPLRAFQDRFHLPHRDGERLRYFCGNSLGLQPKTVRAAIEHELIVWQNLAVEGWFDEDEVVRNKPWLTIHERSKPALAHIVGALETEVCAMNSLTVNMHLLLTSFYQPAGRRTKILTIGGDFPSDMYAFETHLRARGFNPDDVLIEVLPHPGNDTWQPDDLLAAIAQHADTLALVLFSGVHYYTGQVFDMAAVATAAREAGALVGFDLAHGVGNVPLKLHDWQVDFAYWCSYKYLNAGPGGVSGLFVHERHHANSATLPRLAGWWGYDQPKRFAMTKGFVPMPGADGWQVSTPTVLAMAVHDAAVQVTAEAGMDNLRRKSELLTGYLYFLLNDVVRIITPEDPMQRGCQVSVLIPERGKAIFEQLTAAGIIGDWREPDCIRLAPAPLYTSFEDVWHVGNTLRRLLVGGR